MPNLQKNSAGFSLGIVLVGMVVAAVLVGIGLVVFNKSSGTTKTAVTPAAVPAPQEPTAGPTEKPVTGMEKRYTNDQYGFSFSYPQEWRLEELSIDSPNGVVPAEFVVSLKVDVDEKYNDAMVFQVVAKPFEEVKAFYVNEANQSTIAKDTKQDGNEKGKRSTQITTLVPDISRAERYLFDVTGKTYMLESINDELNVKRDNNYWKKFEAVYKSLELR